MTGIEPHISSFLVKFYQNRMKRLKDRSKNTGFWPFQTTNPLNPSNHFLGDSLNGLGESLDDLPLATFPMT